MKKGKVKFFDESKGFGFIKEDDTEEEFFVHITGVNDTINDNDEVTFETVQGKKGINAVNVDVI